MHETRLFGEDDRYYREHPRHWVMSRMITGRFRKRDLFATP
jgi:hypothetical protein